MGPAQGVPALLEELYESDRLDPVSTLESRDEGPRGLVTGLGLGLPFLLLGIWPRIIEKLPRPGNWMTTFKEVMGFLLLIAILRHGRM